MSNIDGVSAGSDQNLLTVIPDTNVLLHGRSLVDLPWSELGRPAIEILFVPPVIKELDKIKNQTGRVNRIARQLIADIRALLDVSNHRLSIQKSNPAVTKRVELHPFTERIHSSLSLDHADQALINYALHLKAAAQDVLLLTDDTICFTTAQGVGLPAKVLPTSWMREPEPDEVSRQNAKLKEDIRRLTAAEPKIAVAFQDRAGGGLEQFKPSITFWPALSENEINMLMAQIEKQYPEGTSFEQETPHAGGALSKADAIIIARFEALMPRFVYEPSTEEEIQRYKTVAYPNWLKSIRAALSSLHDELTSRTQWPTVRAVVRNIGMAPATEVLLGVRARGNFQVRYVETERRDEEDSDRLAQDLKRADITLPPPPQIPRGKQKMIDPFYLSACYEHDAFAAVGSPIFRLPSAPLPWEKRTDAFYRRTRGDDWGTLLEFECKSWRHSGPEFASTLEIRPNHYSDFTCAMELTVQANNVPDPPVTQLPIQVNFEMGSTFDKARSLVDHLALAVLLRDGF